LHLQQTIDNGFAEPFLAGAREGLEMIGENITPEYIEEMAKEIDLRTETTNPLLEVLQTIRG